MSQSTKPDLKELCDIISKNDLARCRAVLLPLSGLEISDLVNSRLGKELREKTPIRFAAESEVQLDIWKLLLHWADERTVCKGALAPVAKLVGNIRLGETRVKPRRQLQKVKHWLEITKTSTSKFVQSRKSKILCQLCRLEGGISCDDASLDDIRNLAIEMIEIYNTDIVGKGDYCPVHWALEFDNICLLSIFLSYEKADPNCLNSDHLTPLLSPVCYGSRAFYLPSVGLLLEYGASLDTEEINRGYRAFHTVLLRLTPSELDRFMKKYCRLWKKSVQGSMPLSPLQGLMVYAPLYSRHRNNRERMQSDIVKKSKVLNKYGCHLDSRDIQDRTILHYACWFKYAKLLEYLLSLGFSPYDKDSFGRGCLYYAVAQPATNYEVSSETECLETLELVVNSPGVEDVDKLGRSGLHFSCFECNLTALKYLLKRRFHKNTRDKAGKSGLECVNLVGSRCDGMIKACLYTGVDEKNEFYLAATKLCSELTEESNNLSNALSDNQLMADKFPIGSKAEEEIYNRKEKGNQRQRHRVVEKLLKDPIYGAVEESEVKHITNDVHLLIDKIAEKLAITEPRFLSRIELTGSFSEGTKLKPPNEFDFQFQLKAISHLFVIDELKSGNDASLNIANSQANNLVSDMIQSKESANKTLFKAFHSAVYKILLSKKFWEGLPFYWCCHKFAGKKKVHKRYTYRSSSFKVGRNSGAGYRHQCGSCTSSHGATVTNPCPSNDTKSGDPGCK